jgi:hypothetical protein
MIGRVIGRDDVRYDLHEREERQKILKVVKNIKLS